MLDNLTRTDTVTVNTQSLRELLEGAATHAGTDKSLPVLNSLLLRGEKGELTAAATDRYRLIEGIVSLDGEGELSATLFQLDDVKKILSMIKGDKSRATAVTIQRQGDTLTISHLSQALVFQALDGTYPPYAHLFPSEESLPVPVESVTYNPTLFADYGKIVGKRGGVTITYYGERKPMKIGITGNAVTWRALLMPMRQS